MWSSGGGDTCLGGWEGLRDRGEGGVSREVGSRPGDGEERGGV